MDGLEKLLKFLKDAQNPITLSNPALDFCVCHYGGDFEKHLEKAKEFLEVLNGFGEEKILINYAGYSFVGSCLSVGDNGKGYEPRTIQIGRLNAVPFKVTMPHRILIANMASQLRFTQGKGWKSDTSIFDLSEFLENYEIGSGNSQLRVDKFEIPAVRTEKTYGGTNITYDSQPVKTLIVGSGAIDNYLLEQDLKVDTKAEYPPLL
jgi:hypothetical protein